MADNLEKKTEAAAKPHKKVDARLIGDLAPIVGLILVIVIFAVLTKGALLSKNNLQSLASSVITTAMCAIGAVFVFGAGYFDMSIGGSLCVAAVLGCKAMIATGSFFVGFLAVSIMMMSSMSYIGVGLAAPTPEWGLILNDGKAYITSAPYMMFFPALMIMITCFAFNLMGDGLRDAFDPKSK